MTTVVMTPNSNEGSGGPVTIVGGSVNAVLADTSDATYVSLQGEGTGFYTTYVVVGLTNPTLPAGAVTSRVTIRTRTMNEQPAEGGNDAVYANMQATLTVGSAKMFGGGVGDLDSFVDWSSSSALVAASTSNINAATLRLATKDGAVRIARAYVDLVYVTRPVVTVTAVSPDPYTESSVVPVSWSSTRDADGGAQTRVQVYVFTSAQYSAPGFDPSLDMATERFDSFTTATSTSFELQNGTYRAYVRTAQTVNGQYHWSLWAYDQFVVNVVTSDVTVAATPSNGTGSITVTVSRVGGSHAWERIEVQRTRDGGTTWENVRRGTYMSLVGEDPDTFAVTDYETGNGETVTYRARATWFTTEGDAVVGAWASSSPAVWSSDQAWLKCPVDPNLNVAICPDQIEPGGRTVRAGVFQVIGRATPVVVSSVMSTPSPSLEIVTETDDEAADLLAALECVHCLLQYPAASGLGSRYVSVLSVEERLVGQQMWMTDRRWSIQTVATEAPDDSTAGR